MNSPRLPEKDMFALELKDFSLASLLEHGLQFVKQGRYGEGALLFAIAREYVSPQQRHLIEAFDVFIHDYTVYWQTQQALQQVSRRFVELDITLREGIEKLELLLPTVIKDIPASSDNKVLLLAAQPIQPSWASVADIQVSAKSSLYSDGATQNGNTLAPLHFTCFGRFEVKIRNQSVVLCANRNGQTILRYLVAQPDHYATMDVLMTELWPEDEQEVAHHKLQVAASALRRSLNSGYECKTGGGYILCKQGAYQINPSITLHSDVDKFLMLYHAGQRATADSSAIALYEQACALYTGPFLPEDLYTDWSSLRREQFSHTYLTMCGLLLKHYIQLNSYEQAVTWASAILKENRCDEYAYRQLMYIYAAQGRRSEALRQYHRCRQVLSEELGIEPMPETTKIFHSLFNGDASSS